jgi:hypothetical protein
VSPKNATTSRTGQRFYTWRAENYWSVTTIIGGGMPKPALLPWGIKSVAEGAVDDRVVLRAMLDKCTSPGECHTGNYCLECERTVKYLKGLPYAHRDRAADIGSYVHAAAEAYVLGKPFPPWPPVVKPRMDAFVRFLGEYRPAFEATEASVYNRTEHYAGTLDAIATIEGRRLLFDHKTGKAVYPEVSLQLAAYRHAEFIGMPDGSEAPMPGVDGAAVLHLPESGEYELLEVRADRTVFTAFLYVRECFRFQEQLSKQVILGPYNEVALLATAAGPGFGNRPAGVPA